MANKVNITNTKNNVTVTPQNDNNIETTATNTPITVTQGNTSVVTVNTPGPQGVPGLPGPGALDANSNILANSISSSKFFTGEFPV